MYDRILYERLRKKIFKGKAIVILGPRQTGKTTLVQQLLKDKTDILFLDGDDPLIRTKLDTPNTEELKQIVGNHKIVFIDEAQRINNIGITAKIIVDQIKNTQLLLSGSSSLDLGNYLNEPLTGRKWEYHLYPISWEELRKKTGPVKSEQQLKQRLVFGMYPDVLNHTGEEINVLKNLVNSYLYKDILSLTGIKKPEILEQLLQALALQVGNEVSLNELSSLLGVAKETVGSYIDLLVKTFVIFKLPAFNRNMRSEIKTNKKIYFYDNGLRNAIINNFNPIDMRSDKGQLWENFLISERKKHNEYHENYCNAFFWRTKQQQEIDYIEERGGTIYAFEFKWKLKNNIKLPGAFSETYNPEFLPVDTTNFLDFVAPI